jgi:hypothetical protein
VAVNDDQDLGYSRIRAGLSARFGSCFRVERVGECVMMVAQLEGGVEVMITDCGVSLTPVDWHLDGRGSGYYVGIHRVVANESGADTDDFEQVGYACDVEALPTVEAIGELVEQAMEWTRFLRETH